MVSHVSILQGTEAHVYSVVDKSKKKKKSTETHVYSIVDKRKKKRKTSQVRSYTIYMYDTVHVLSYMHMPSTHVTISALKCNVLCIHIKNMYIHVHVGRYSCYKTYTLNVCVRIGKQPSHVCSAISFNICTSMTPCKTAWTMLQFTLHMNWCCYTIPI